jgi:hypothetical protein
VNDENLVRPDVESVALNAAIEWRAHRRHCPICATQPELCDVGGQLLRLADRSLRALGDGFSTRGRIAQQL